MCDPFIVPFGWNSAAIPAHIEDILRNVIEACARAECPRVRLSAHADSSGSRDYNAQLSRRRARAIVTYLEQHGLRVPMTIEIIGEDRPLLQTADGVREPYNRFVWVDTCPPEVPEDDRPADSPPAS